MSRAVANAIAPAIGLSVATFLTSRLKLASCEDAPNKKLRMPQRPRLDGIIIPWDCKNADSVRQFRKLDTNASDVISVSYPKTGTTWVHQILYYLLRMDDEGNCPSIEGDIVAKGQVYPDFVPLQRPEQPHPLMGFKTYPDLLAQPSPRLISCHLPRQFLPEEGLAKQGRLVYIMRNPKDTLTSAHFFRLKMDKVLKSACAEAREKAGWTGHPEVEGTRGSYHDWNAWPNEACDESYGLYYWHMQEMDKLVTRLGQRATCVYYEQLHEDFPGELRRLAAFLGVSLSEKKLAEIAKRVSFEQMVADKRLTARKGMVGDHKSHLTPELWQAMDSFFEERLGHVSIAQPLRRWL